MHHLILFVIAPVAAYLLGSIPFGLLIGLANGVDIRKTGSGNIGATNLGRTLGHRFFWYAFVLDFAKGFLPVLAVAVLTRHWHEHVPQWTPILTGVAAMVGHVLPIYLKFKGGKGVATSFGVVLGFWPLFTLAGVGAGLAFVVVVLGWRYISAASLAGATAFVVLVPLLGRQHTPVVDAYLEWSDLLPLVGIAVLFAAVIAYKHRTNIRRLMAGTEPKVGQKKAAN